MRSIVTFSDAGDEIVVKPRGLLNRKLTVSSEAERRWMDIRISRRVEGKN